MAVSCFAGKPAQPSMLADVATLERQYGERKTDPCDPAQRTALDVLAANGVHTVIQCDDSVTPTPVISRAILVHNRGRAAGRADGIVITPSHNPPEDGGTKYNPSDGGPAETALTRSARPDSTSQSIHWERHDRPGGGEAGAHVA